MRIGIFATESTPKKAIASKKDLKLIQCDVCSHAMSHIVGRLRTLSSGRFATYDEVDRVLEDSCDIVKVDSWIRTLDIQEQANRTLALVPGGGVSLCGIECMTIRKKCTSMVDEDMDRERIVDHLHTKLKQQAALEADDVKNTVCQQWLKVCPSKHTLPEGEARKDEVFTAMAEADVAKERQEWSESARLYAQNHGITAIFLMADDMDKVRAKLYFQEKFIGNLNTGGITPQRHQTFMGHTWTVKINGKVVKTWGIGIEPVQYFTLTWADVNLAIEL